MDRREFLRLAGRAAILGAVGVGVAACPSNPTPRPTTGGPTGSPSTPTGSTGPPSSSPMESEAGPPTDADWAALRGSLTGSLVLPSDPGYTTARELFQPRFDAVRPQAVVLCATESDVQHAVAFARTHGIVPTPRAGGHSYAGYSTGTGIVVDIGRLDRVVVGRGSVAVGAGARLIDLYAAIAPVGVAVPGGTCPSVGVAGLALGGGQGVVGRKLGLTCDAMTSVRMVTAAGDLITCDERSNADLFWASRGGGGGNFGIATGFELRTTPIGDVTLFSLHWPWAAAADVLGAWQAWGPDAPQELWSDCHLLARAGDPPGPLSSSVNGVLIGSAAALAPLLSDLRRAVGTEADHSYTSTLSYGAAMTAEAGCSGMTIEQCHLPNQNPGGLLRRASSLARSDFFAQAIPGDAIDAAVRAIAARQGDPGLGTTGGVLFDAFGGAINLVAPAATAFVHREQRFLAQYFANLPDPASSSTLRANQAWLDGLYGTLHPRASGEAYQNYIDPSLAGWDRAYYGSNLTRLLATKESVDPEGLFRFPQGLRTG